MDEKIAKLKIAVIKLIIRVKPKIKINFLKKFFLLDSSDVKNIDVKNNAVQANPPSL